MRTYLIFSGDGSGVSLAMKIEREGHRAIVYVNDIEKRCVGEGLVEKAKLKDQIIDGNGSLDTHALSSLLKEVNPDCVVFSGLRKGIGKASDEVRKERPVVGVGMWGEVISTDPTYNDKVLRLCGMDKPLSQGNEQVKIDTSILFNGKECVKVFYSMNEYSFMDGNIGPQTSGMGCVVWKGAVEHRLYIEGIRKFEDTLQRVDYRGIINLSLIVTKDKVYGDSIYCGFTNAFFVFNELLKDSVSDVFYGIATGIIKRVDVREGVGMGVTIAILPFPLPISYNGARDVELGGVTPSNIAHLWLGDVYKKEAQYLCSGLSGNLGMVTARWDTPGESPLREAKRRCYRTLSNLCIPDVMYRKDIGERVARDKMQLEKWGWI